MASKACFLLLLSVLLATTALALSSRHEERDLQKCKELCKDQPYFGKARRRHCQEQCEERYGQHEHDSTQKQDPEERLQRCQQLCSESRHGQERQECRHQCLHRYQEEKGRSRDEVRRQDPEQQFEECVQLCRQQGGRQQWHCEEMCERIYEQERRERERDRDLPLESIQLGFAGF